MSDFDIKEILFNINISLNIFKIEHQNISILYFIKFLNF